jgi:uncharacterized Zn finger protein
MVKGPVREETIRALATPESFARGHCYFGDGAVSDLIRCVDRLTAEVEGSEFAPHEVSIRLHDGGVAEARCSCPYDWGGYCKHIVAALLKFAHVTTHVIEHKPITELLRGLDQAQLIELLEKRAESDSELAAWIDAELATTVETLSPRDQKASRRRTAVDPEPVPEHARNLLAKRQPVTAAAPSVGDYAVSLNSGVNKMSSLARSTRDHRLSCCEQFCTVFTLSWV